jgi:nucleotide-binding universal stress UspA family protein
MQSIAPRSEKMSQAVSKRRTTRAKTGSSASIADGEAEKRFAGLKDVVVHLEGTAEDEGRIAHGEAIAAMHDAHLTGVFTNLLPDFGTSGVPGDAGAATAAMMLELEERARREGASTFARLQQRFSRLAATNELRRIDATLGAMCVSVAAEARWGDLFVATCPYRGQASPGWDEVLEAVLFESGHGVYFVPPGVRPRALLARVLVAWTHTREAARAVAEALPFLRSASEAEITIVESPQQLTSRGYAGVDIAGHLDRHDVRCTILPVERGKRSIGEVLLAQSRLRSADLIVMGAYGHSRWREWIIGGTTRELLAGSKVPLLMAH